MAFQANSGEPGIARKHLQGALAMIQFKGGPKSFSLTGLLERMYHKFIKVLKIKDVIVDLQ